MIDQESKQAVIDEEHLRLLRLGYLVSGGMTAFFSLFGLLYAGMGVMMTTIIASAAKTSPHPENAPPAEIGWIFGCFGLAIFVFFMAMALAKFKAASLIRQRRSRTFCMVVGGLSCLEIPYGTCLGIATFMVLGRPSVQRLFGVSSAA